MIGWRAEVPAAAPAPEAIVAPVATSPARPRIGLVLGGGGAKGAAHVGVLTLLDEMHIPIDCVVGTSMGALVGGTYASGQTATELEKSIRSISWADTIAFQVYRERLPMRRKVAGVTYSNSLQFGFKDGRITAPRGFINTQNVAQTIKWLVALTLVSRTLDVLIGASEKQQLATLGPGDVTIIVPMGEVGSASFDKVGEAIPMGRAAAELHRAELARYSSWPAITRPGALRTAVPSSATCGWPTFASRASTG